MIHVSVTKWMMGVSGKVEVIKITFQVSSESPDPGTTTSTPSMKRGVHTNNS